MSWPVFLLLSQFAILPGSNVLGFSPQPIPAWGFLAPVTVCTTQPLGLAVR